jgi:hypothetical protein
MSVKVDVTARIELWKTLPLSDPQWRVVWESFHAYSKGQQADISWRRLNTKEGLAKAKYVARVAYRAMKGRRLPEGNSWGHLRSALKVVYDDLEARA